MDPPSAHEAEGGVHGPGALHLPLVKAPHGVRVIEVHAARVVIQAHAHALRHGQHALTGHRGDQCRGRGGGGGSRGLGDEELAHAQGEEGEGLGELVARVLAAAVVAAVLVVPKKRQTFF